MLSVAFGEGGDICYSGSADSTIRVWRLPVEGGDDPFTIYGETWPHISCNCELKIAVLRVQ